jgi:transmembrane sensor
MSNIHQIHLQSKHQQTMLDAQRLEQACEWIARIDRELQEEEQVALQQWLAASPLNQQELFEVAKLWDKMDALSRLSALFGAVEPHHAQHDSHNSSQTSSHSANQGKRSFRTLAMAASTAALLLLGGLLYRSEVLPMVNPSSSIASMQATYQTRVGENTTIELPDSSKLVLNTNSFVVVRYSAAARVIELQRGEINIDVAHDTSRPLSVIAGGKIIQAVGTAFNVDLRKDHVELIVTDGKVLVGSNPGDEPPAEQLLSKRLPQSSLAISKGEWVDLDPKGQAPEQVQRMDAVELAASLSWRSGNLIFRGENLEDALAEISRYTDIEFELADDAKLKQIHVAGMFKTGDVNGLLEVFRSNFNISHERLSRDKILLKFAG